MSPRTEARWRVAVALALLLGSTIIVIYPSAGHWLALRLFNFAVLFGLLFFGIREMRALRLGNVPLSELHEKAKQGRLPRGPMQTLEFAAVIAFSLAMYRTP